MNKSQEEWIKSSNGTNEYCERSLLVDALYLLEKDPPNVEKAVKRLREVIPCDGSGSGLIEPPEWSKEYEKSLEKNRNA